MRTSKILSLLVWGTGLGCVAAWYTAALAGLADSSFSWRGLLVMLGALALPTVAALRPDLWAHLLGNGAWNRIRLPLWMALFSVPLAGAVWLQLAHGSATGAPLFYALGVVGLGGGGVLLRFQGAGAHYGPILRGGRFAAVALSAMVAVLAAVIGLRPGAGGGREQALTRYLASLPQSMSFRLDPSDEPDTTAPSDIEVLSHAPPPKEVSVHTVQVGFSENQESIAYFCLGTSCGVRSAAAHSKWGDVFLPRGAQVTVYEDTSRGAFVMVSGSKVFELIDDAKIVRPLPMAALLSYLWLPPVWMLAPFASLLGLAILSGRRQRADAWARAIAGGEDGEVVDGRLLVDGHEFGEVAVRDGRVTILGAESAGSAYRSSGQRQVEWVLPGRREKLAVKAQSSVAVLDAWALALASLTAAPMLGLLLARFF